MTELIYKNEVYQIIGAAIEVHKELGCGFLEAVYQEALEIEFRMRNIPFVSQPVLNLFYKDEQLQKKYIPDFICYDKIVVEIKALDILTGREESQIINELKASEMIVGVLINFGSYKKLEWQRFVYDTAKQVSIRAKNLSVS